MDGPIRFGEFEIDVAALELRRAGQPVPVPPQAVRALIVLVRNAGRLVTREELYAELWPEPDVDVDRGLNTVIRQIRLGLGDDATDPTFIRTYPRRGYRFLAQAAPVEPGMEPGADGGSLPSSRRRAPWGADEDMRRRVMWSGAVLTTAATILLVLIGFAIDWELPSGATDGSGAAAVAEAELPDAVRERYLEGRYLLESPSPERRAAAIEPLTEVVSAAPDFAGGHAWLADALFWAGRLTDARASAQAALDLDGNQARALIVRGTVRLIRDWDGAGAEHDIREAVRLAGDEPEPHHALAFVLSVTGRHAAAVHELETAHRLDPISAIVTGDLGLIHLYAGNLHEAAGYCQRARSIEPRAAWAIGCAFDALAALGRFTDARPLAIELVRAAGDSPIDVLGGQDIGDDEAIRRFHVWRADRAQRALSEGGSAWSAALALSGAGRVADAVSALEQAARERGMGFVTITIDPRFRPLWSDPVFRSLAADLAEHGFAALPS